MIINDFDTNNMGGDDKKLFEETNGVTNIEKI